MGLVRHWFPAMCRLLKIAGDSLSPEFEDGDFALASRIPFLLRLPRPGDVVAFRKPPYGLLVKRVERLEPDGELFVVGTRPESVDSRQFGSIRKRDLVGKVIWHVKKPAAR